MLWIDLKPSTGDSKSDHERRAKRKTVRRERADQKSSLAPHKILRGLTIMSTATQVLMPREIMDIKAAANYLGVSRSHLSHILAGRSPVSPQSRMFAQAGGH
jgi:hypothetical protein